MKKIILFLFVLSSLFAEIITDYHVKIEVLQSGSLNIEENILYDFGEKYRHGIYRDIPYTVKTDFLPKNIGLDDFFILRDSKETKWEKVYTSSSDAGDMIRLKIGDPKKTIKGKHSYLIRYSVKKGVLPKNDRFEAIRWNAIGTGWKVPIKKAVIDLYLPPSLTKGNARISTFTGRYASTSTKAKVYGIDKNHVRIEVHDLKPHEGVTVEAAYKKGLLDQSSKENTTASFTDYILAFWQWPAFGAFLLFLYRFYKEHSLSSLDKHSIAPMYEPPKGMDVLQAGLIYDRFADTKDFSAAVIELAQKGYMDIYKEKDLISFKRTDKDSKELDFDEKYLLENILFPHSDLYVLTKNDPNNAQKMRKGFEKINENLYKWSVANGYMRENPKRVRKEFLKKSFFIFIPFIILGFITSVMTIGIADTIMIGFMSVFIIAGLFIILSSKDKSGKVFGIFFTGMSLFIFSSGLISQIGGLQKLLFTPIPFLILGAIFIYLAYRKIGDFTQKGADAYLHLKGFEEFIKRVKEDEIKRILKEDPLYLEKTLPFAMLFGKVKHWLSLYKRTETPAPVWYYGDFGSFNTFSNDLNSFSSLSSTSSGGMSGGGGFSGGGGGGGGGGSW